MIGRLHRLSLAAAGLVALGLIAAPSSGDTATWSPLGPALVLDGAAWPGRVPVTGRINVVAPNPENPLGDIWIGSAGGGAWRGMVSPIVAWQPMTDGAPALSVGDIQLDSCGEKRCNTVWIATGENGIRRDTQHGRGVLKGIWISDINDYNWMLLGEGDFAHGSITRLLLDPSTSDGAAKRLYVALSSGTTSNSTHSTITTFPKGDLGIWRSDDAGKKWENVLDLGAQATDLEMDPQQPQVLFAGFRGQGLHRSTDGGDSWDPITNGIPPALVEAADWPELAVHRAPGDPAAILYAVLGACPHPHEKAGADAPYCSPAVYRSDDSGDSWYEVRPAVEPPPEHGSPLTAYTSYTHALTIHPTNPNRLWFGGINLYYSADAGQTWHTVGNRKLPPHHHQVVIVPTDELPGGYAFYDVSDGGFFVGDGEEAWNGTFQHGLGVAQVHSVSALGKHLVGSQGNGTSLFLGTDVWLHASDGGASSTLIDLDNGDTFFATTVGVAPRRCTLPGLCPFTWQDVAGQAGLTGALPQSPHTSWYPPFVQDPSGVLGQHILYYGAQDLYRNAADGGDPTSAPGWAQMTPPGLGGADPMPELGGILNPITAVAVAPSNPDRLYLGYYDGRIFTSANALSTNPLWAPAASGLPHRPVAAIAVSPGDDLVVLAAFEGTGEHALFRSANAGLSWAPFDDALDPSLAERPIHAVVIEPGAPSQVWVGTEDGVYTRQGLDPGVDLFAKTEGLPNVPVYDLEIADGALYAATHGRGVWMRSAQPRATVLLEDCCGYASSYFPEPFIAVSAAGFEPGQTCSMTIFGTSGACATESVDAGEADLHTDARGFLVASKLGDYENRPLAWACYGGKCLNGVPYASCPVSTVSVTCGDRQVVASVLTPAPMANPSSTLLSFTPAGSGGVLTVTPVIKQNGGASRALCEVMVDYGPGEPEATVLDRVADAINASTDCGRGGLEAYLVGNAVAGLREGEGPTPIRLALRAPWTAGLQLVTEVRLTGKGTVGLSGFGELRHGSAVVPRVTLSGTAAGGKLVFRVSSPLGNYSLNVDASTGDSAAMLATTVFDGMTGRDTGGGLPIGGTGGPPKKPYAAVQFGTMVDLPHVLSLEVESTDAGITVTIGSGVVGRAHPRGGALRQRASPSVIQ